MDVYIAIYKASCFMHRGTACYRPSCGTRSCNWCWVPRGEIVLQCPGNWCSCAANRSCSQSQGHGLPVLYNTQPQLIRVRGLDMAIYAYIWLYMGIYGYIHSKICILGVWTCILAVWACFFVSELVFLVSGLVLWVSGLVFWVSGLVFWGLHLYFPKDASSI